MQTDLEIKKNGVETRGSVEEMEAKSEVERSGCGKHTEVGNSRGREKLQDRINIQRRGRTAGSSSEKKWNEEMTLVFSYS